ncbi:tRNA (adenosine(37)-N6)-threonylcarbamoyltransferase complex transferase subunit TsaD [Bacillota bacterium LX-D]|nr:tRNA (adenosine(37)-N6)-threonylcarbamoyltransferase complex transferase subunit TsaD [Bacillota bacterium LX-D]
MKKDIVILGVETSCDETSVAVVCNGVEVKSNIISSQIATHQKFGGVVPEIASRKHLENIIGVVHEALRQANLDLADLDAVAVTYGPGLVGALLVGVSTAKAIAYALHKPLIGVHHIAGHIYANFLTEPHLELPVACLVVSGGHTNLVHWQEHGRLKLLGSTRDDAAGEAFDKIARALHLGYPGGPAIEKTALQGNPRAIDFPRAWLEEGSFDFSFSGLKSSVLNYLNRLKQNGQEVNVPDVAASFQEAVVEVLVTKSLAAAEQLGVKTLTLAGGVAANSRLREELFAKGQPKGIKIIFPELVYCTDNAAMIGCAAYFQYLRGETSGLDLNAVPNLPLFN